MKKNRARKKWPARPGSVALGRELRPLPGCPALRAHAWSWAALASGSLWPAGPAPPGGFGPFPCNPTHDLDPSLAKTLGGRVFAGCGVPRPARPGVTASPAHPLPVRPCEQSAALVRPPLSAVSVVLSPRLSSVLPRQPSPDTHSLIAASSQEDFPELEAQGAPCAPSSPRPQALSPGCLFKSTAPTRPAMLQFFMSSLERNFDENGESFCTWLSTQHQNLVRTECLSDCAFVNTRLRQCVPGRVTSAWVTCHTHSSRI